jgi:hypothetical protein
VSTRLFFVPITSTSQLFAALGSDNIELIDELVPKFEAGLRSDFADSYEFTADDLDEIESDIADFRADARSLIGGAPLDREPGRWHYVVDAIIEHLGLFEPLELPFNSFGYPVGFFEAYVQEVVAHLAPQGLTNLRYICDGRPIRGGTIEHDGCQYAWMDPSEIQVLLVALQRVDSSVLSSEGLRLLHSELVESLGLLRQGDLAVYIGAQ